MRSWASMLRTARAPIAVLFLGVLGLVVPSQTRDMVAAIEDHAVSFQIALLLLAFSAWFWSRALLAARFLVPDSKAERALISQDTIDETAFVWLPRLLFIAGASIGVALLWGPLSWGGVLAILLWGAALICVLMLRQRLPLLVNKHPPHEPRDGSWVRRRISEPLLRLVGHAPISTWLAWGLLGLGILAFLAGGIESFLPQQFFRPDWPGLAALFAEGFPGPGIAVLGLALMIGPLAVLTFLADGFKWRWLHLRRPPVILALALWIFILAPWWLELHAVRLFEPGGSKQAALAAPSKRSTLPDFLDAWAECQKAGPLRPVVVAISGGATRAGLWGARVLQAVDEAAAMANRDHVIFAISSVSGGSLGAAAYLSLHARRTDSDGCSIAAKRDNRDAYLSLGNDALGPLLAGRLLGDLPRTLLAPAAWLFRQFQSGEDRQLRGGDSAEAIERAFEHLWRPREASHDARGFNEAFLTLAYRNGEPRRGMPIWIANGTDAASGNRIVTVPFKEPEVEVEGNGTSDWPIRGARDALALLQSDVPISTAINNTARFPFLEPFGTLLREGDGARGGALIDGGYFENEGLQTALELVGWLAIRGPELLGRPVEPIVVVATGNGDTITPGPVRCIGPTDDSTTRSTDNVLQLLAPLLGLYDTRGGHSYAALRQAREQYCAQGHPRFFHFYLPQIDGRNVPLNWILSKDIARKIWDALYSDRGNQEQFNKLVMALTP